MDLNAIPRESEKFARSGILDRHRFGRSGSSVLWINPRDLQALARGLRADPEMRIDWLENLSIAQLGPSLVVTYFLRSTSRPAQVILRCAIDLPDGGLEVRLPSVRETWPMAAMMEDRSGELFGVEFLGGDGKSQARKSSLLPENFIETRGFPMRKGMP